MNNRIKSVSLKHVDLFATGGVGWAVLGMVVMYHTLCRLVVSSETSAQGQNQT